MPAVRIASDLQQLARARRYAAADTVDKRRELLIELDPEMYTEDTSPETVNAAFLGGARYLLGDLLNIIGNLTAESQ